VRQQNHGRSEKNSLHFGNASIAPMNNFQDFTSTLSWVFRLFFWKKVVKSCKEVLANTTDKDEIMNI